MGSGDSPAQFYQKNSAFRAEPSDTRQMQISQASRRASIPYVPHSKVVLCTRGSEDSSDFLPFLERSCWLSPEDPCRARSRLEMNVCRTVTPSLAAFPMMAAG